MKKHLFTPPRLQVVIFTAALLTMCNLADAQIKVKPDGKVGIGIFNPDAPLQIHGDKTKFSFPTSGGYTPTPIILDRYYGDTRFYPSSDNKGYIGLNWLYWNTSYTTTGYFDNLHYLSLIHDSDAKVKKDVKPLKNSLENVLKLKPCQFDFDFSNAESEHLQQIDTGKYTNQYGFIAQELMEIYPDLVKLDTSTNLLGIDYIGLIAILTAAIQEQNGKIKELDDKLKAEAINTKSTDTDIPHPLNSAFLEKNKPNPFTENTTIEYYLPFTVQNAVMYVYDLQGKQLKSIRIAEREYGSVIIHGNELQPGIYHYSLIADGQVVGIEKMILTE